MGFSLAVQREDFDVGAEYQALLNDNSGAEGQGAEGLAAEDLGIGGLVFFVGRVRDNNASKAVSGLFLEHYPGMTEQVLAELMAEAQRRWSLCGARIVHRIGQLSPGDQIVFVATASAHRAEAFAAAEFLMDSLKTRAPFWKKELTDGGEHWLDERAVDQKAAARWE